MSTFSFLMTLWLKNVLEFGYSRLFLIATMKTACLVEERCGKRAWLAIRRLLVGREFKPIQDHMSVPWERNFSTLLRTGPLLVVPRQRTRQRIEEAVSFRRAKINWHRLTCQVWYKLFLEIPASQLHCLPFQDILRNIYKILVAIKWVTISHSFLFSFYFLRFHFFLMSLTNVNIYF